MPRPRQCLCRFPRSRSKDLALPTLVTALAEALSRHARALPPAFGRVAEAPAAAATRNQQRHYEQCECAWLRHPEGCRINDKIVVRKSGHGGYLRGDSRRGIDAENANVSHAKSVQAVQRRSIREQGQNRR